MPQKPPPYLLPSAQELSLLNEHTAQSALEVIDRASGRRHSYAVFGMACGTLEELHGCLERVRSFAAADSSIEFEDIEVVLLDDVRPYKLHRFYVRLATPFAFEVQWYEWLDQAASADSAPAGTDAVQGA